MSATQQVPNLPTERQLLQQRFRATRDLSVKLIQPLSVEDACVQSMPDCSPAKWHLAHTTWFFETFLLELDADYRCFHPQFRVLFNSYYNAVGKQHPRPDRGMLTRPSLDEVLAYRRHVDAKMMALFDTEPNEQKQRIIEVGIQHEQQHQELLLMDIKHLLAQNPLQPCYVDSATAADNPAVDDIYWMEFEGGLVNIGTEAHFCFDNETPQHQHYLQNYKIADRLVTNREYLEFINDGAYSEPTLWLADGWATVQSNDWQAPLYWRKPEEQQDPDAPWRIFTLHGETVLTPDAPVVHLSFYEADAFARWAGARLPSEMEWEHAVLSSGARHDCDGMAPLGSRILHPTAPAQDKDTPGRLNQVFSDVWQWTSSAYLPYPGYHPPAGAIGEYNGKFMSNQMVLKGACCVTPDGHSRPSYRNFFYPHCRWQFAGIRLAK